VLGGGGNRQRHLVELNLVIKEIPGAATCSTSDHEAFRALARDFVEEGGGSAHPSVRRAGLCPATSSEIVAPAFWEAIPEYGGAGMPTTATNVGCRRGGRALVTLVDRAHPSSRWILPYFLHYANADMRDRLFPVLCLGHVADGDRDDRTGTGSIWQACAPPRCAMGRRHRQRGQDLLTAACQADLVIVVARTERPSG